MIPQPLCPPARYLRDSRRNRRGRGLAISVSIGVAIAVGDHATHDGDDPTAVALIVPLSSPVAAETAPSGTIRARW